MKFLITRTSQSSHYDTPPCEGAMLVNTRPYKWGIEFETLDDFLAFCKKQKHQVIIGTPFDPSDYSDIELEIYDDYRE